jgi:hypothetical protein
MSHFTMSFLAFHPFISISLGIKLSSIFIPFFQAFSVGVLCCFLVGEESSASIWHKSFLFNPGDGLFQPHNQSVFGDTAFAYWASSAVVL